MQELMMDTDDHNDKANEGFQYFYNDKSDVLIFVGEIFENYRKMKDHEWLDDYMI